ncbi:hypothetical protein GGI43DRAFT_395597 [Trichoderma evansii]
MEAVGNTASTSHAIIHVLVRATKNAIEFNDEFERYQLKLDTLKIRLEAVRKINDAKVMQDRDRISLGQERSLAQIIANVQHAVSKAHHDATRISRLQWVIYKRDSCCRSIADIDTLVGDLEMLASS